MPKLVAALVTAAALAVSSAPLVAQRVAVTPAATDIRGFRLTADHLRGLQAVTQAMDALPDRGPEAPRSDAATFTVLSMSLAFNEPFTERTVPETVRTIESGHPELTAAVRRSGLSLRDYVLTQIVLLLTYPSVAAERQGRSPAVADGVSPETLAFVRANWPTVERTMQGVLAAVARYVR